MKPSEALRAAVERLNGYEPDDANEDLRQAILLAHSMEAVVEAAQVYRELGPHSMQARIKLCDAVDALHTKMMHLRED